jgi:glycerol-3-phosphate acyltransferase PlsY
MAWWTECAAIASAYAIGCLTAGYYLVRWRTGQDIRLLGSGGTGAKNVGRVLGPWGFILTFLCDMGKGALAMVVAGGLAVDPWVMPMALLAVVAGHTWPVQLGFRGGKGIATSLGALLVYDPGACLLLAGAFVLALLITQNLVVSGLWAFAVLPALSGLFGPTLWRGLVYLGLAALLIYTHRHNLLQEQSRLGRWRRIKEKPADAGKCHEARTSSDV